MKKKTTILLCSIALITGFLLAQLCPLPYTAAGKLSEAEVKLISSITSSENNLYLAHNMQNPPNYRLDDCLPLIENILSGIDVGQATGLLPKLSDELSAIRAFWGDIQTAYRSIAYDIAAGIAVEDDDRRLYLVRQAMVEIAANTDSFHSSQAWINDSYQRITEGEGAAIVTQLSELCRILAFPNWQS